jgi:hypothetical protein
MRLYGFVMYNLSGIQKGIQHGHAALEYASQFRDDPKTWEFIDKHKTFILLSGGGSIDMLDRMRELDELGVKYAIFREPDLNNSVSAITFIVDEKDYQNDPMNLSTKLGLYLKRFQLASN